MRVWCVERAVIPYSACCRRRGEERKGGEEEGKVMMSDGWWNSRRKEKKQKKGAVCGAGGIFKPPVISQHVPRTKIIRRALLIPDYGPNSTYVLRF